MIIRVLYIETVEHIKKTSQTARFRLIRHVFVGTNDAYFRSNASVNESVYLTLEVLCRLCATSFIILPSYSFIGHHMFRRSWPSLGVHVVMVKDSAAHCNTVLFPPNVVASDATGY
jgi:hypothetical protein